MKRLPFYLFLYCCLLSFSNSFAQPDTLIKKGDSVNAELIGEYNKRLHELEQQRIEDSLKKVDLEKQLSALSTTENLKKEELNQQLLQLNEQERKRIAEKKARIDSLRHTALSFPVMGFFGDTLFKIYSRLGSFSASDRAAAIEKRVHDLTDDYRFRPDSLVIVEAETTIDLVVGEKIIMSISENDAFWNNTTKTDLATAYKEIIGAAVMNYRSETSFVTLAKEVGLALLVIAIMCLLIIYLIKLFKWIAVKIRQQEGKRIKGIKIKSYTLFDARSQVNALLSINNIVKWIFIILTVYIALPILFGIFPWTKNFTSTLFGYILNPLKKMWIGLWNYFPNLITIIVIIIVFRFVLKAIRFFKNEIEKGNLHISGFYADWANPTYQIIKVIIYAFMAILIFPYLPGSNSPIFRGVSVFLGVLFTFGSAGSLANVVAGLVLTYMRLFKLGERVKIGEVVGDVIEKSLLVTRIRTIKNEVISIPNLTVMSSHTINYSSEAKRIGLILHTTVTIGYDVPWKDMHAALLKAADRTESVLKDPPPFVLQTSLDDFYVSYQINAYTHDANKQAVIYSDLHSNIQDCCNEAGIEILSPHYRAARDGNATTIPQNYLDKDYKAPGFKFDIGKGFMGKQES